MSKDYNFDMSNFTSRVFSPDYSDTFIDTKGAGVSGFHLKSKILNCRKCPLSSYSKPLSLTNMNASLMIVGEYPKDVMFDTEEGRVLSNALKMNSFDFDDIYMTAAVKCIESSNFMECQSNLLSEVIVVNPLIVVSLGYNAGAQLMNSINNPGDNEILPNGSDILVTYSMKEVISNEVFYNSFLNHMGVVSKQLEYRQQQRSYSYA